MLLVTNVDHLYRQSEKQIADGGYPRIRLTAHAPQTGNGIKTPQRIHDTHSFPLRPRELTEQIIFHANLRRRLIFLSVKCMISRGV